MSRTAQSRRESAADRRDRGPAGGRSAGRGPGEARRWPVSAGARFEVQELESRLHLSLTPLPTAHAVPRAAPPAADVVTFGLAPAGTSRAPASTAAVTHSLLTGATTTAPLARTDPAPASAGTPAAPAAGPTVSTVFGNDDRAQVANAKAFPYSAVGQFVAVFPSGAFFEGTGVLVDAYHVLTAAHAVYIKAEGGFATDAAFFPATNGLPDPYGGFGVTATRVYDQWVAAEAPADDFALVTLDHNIGNVTGFFGYEARTDAQLVGSAVRTAGYPNDKAFATQWEAAGTVDSVDASELYVKGTLDTAAGQDGSPLWRDTGGGPVVDGVVAYEAADANLATRLTPGKVASLDAWRAADTPPVDLPNLADHDFFSAVPLSTISVTDADPGSPFSVTAAIDNVGVATAGAFRVDFFLSDDGFVGDDVALGGTDVAKALPFQTVNVTRATTLPADLPPASYIVYWVIDSLDQVTEEFEDDNLGAYQQATLNVPIDHDDQIAEATPVAVGPTPIAGTIDPTTDVDMYAVTVAAGAKLTFDIDTPAGDLDPALVLFDADGNELDFSDDNPAVDETDFDTLDAYFEYEFGDAGTYYVGVSTAFNTFYDPVGGGFDEIDDPANVGPYQLIVELSDQDDEIAEAVPLAVGTTRNDALSKRSDVDLYEISVYSGQRVGIDVDPRSGSTANAYLRLFDADGVQVAAVDDGVGPGETAGKLPYLDYTFLTGGTYYVGISSFPNVAYDPESGDGDVAGGTTGAYSISLANLSPVIGSLSASPAVAVKGQTVTLTANGVTNPGGAATRVRFFRDTNGVPGLQLGTGGDTFLSEDAAGPAYTATFSTAALTAGQTYTYYARAVDSRGSLSKIVSTTNQVVAREFIVDNASLPASAITGAWSLKTSPTGFFGANYLSDGNAGKGTKQVKYTANLATAGQYQVFAQWASATGNASNAKYAVAHAGGTTTVSKNQKTGGGVWQLLGTFTFAAGTAGSVTVKNAGTDGTVVADAVRFVRVI
jgi:V8-like Glu-specific endopeptidase